jgi:hypothetical protein
LISDEVFVSYEKFHLPEEEIEMITFLRQSIEEQYSIEPKIGLRVTFRYGSGKK